MIVVLIVVITIVIMASLIAFDHWHSKGGKR